MSESSNPNIKPTTVVIEEPLTDEEIAEKASKLCSLMTEIEKEEDGLKEVKDAAKERIGRLTKRLETFRHEIETKRAEKEVQAVEFLNFADGKAYAYRDEFEAQSADGKPLRVRPITYEERQAVIPEGGPDPSADDAQAEADGEGGGGDDAYEQGAAAKLRGDFLSANPYEPGSYDFVSWENGYHEAESVPGGA